MHFAYKKEGSLKGWQTHTEKETERERKDGGKKAIFSCLDFDFHFTCCSYKEGMIYEPVFFLYIYIC